MVQVPDVLESSVMHDGVLRFPSGLSLTIKLEQQIVLCRRFFVYHGYWYYDPRVLFRAFKLHNITKQIDLGAKSNVVPNRPELPVYIGT